MSMMQAGSFSLETSGASATNVSNTSSFKTVNFNPPFPKGADVIVIPMIQSFNGADTPGIRITDVTPQGFKIRMNELVVFKNDVRVALSDGGHYTEKCGWVAFTT